MAKYTLLDATGNAVCTIAQDDPDDALEQAAKELGKPLTFDGEGKAPYLLIPTDQTSDLEGTPTIVEPERVVYVATRTIE
ncbi:hypothetical protein [Aureimonas leprariae]|uniref:Uncharacterized protein n=1 Tax=Plantimonas leprariae TaxID=2615207 RepID=A0A7V7TXI2_9HYPH|nr:hypothetical protein [Aureimonas leprariae]KAB0681371.1 hypothetical protein F6X38_05665 [Aureimonas leprariae]